MSEAKAKALNQDTNIKVELFCGAALIGNDPKTINITDLLNWTFPESVAQSGSFSELPYFGGITGYRTTNYADGKEVASETTLLYTEGDLKEIKNQILNLLQASIVNAKQLEALNNLVQKVFAQMRYDKGNSLYFSKF